MAHAVAIAPSGEIAIGGSFTDEADLLGLPLVARTGDVDGFVAVLSSAGVPVWAHSFGGTGADAVHSLDFDEAGNLYAAGSFSQSIDFGSGSRLDTAGRRDGFVVKLSLAGDAMWSSGLGGGGTDRANRVAAGDEVVLVAGTFEDRAALGDNTIKSRGRHDVFVAKLSERGVPMWLRNLGGIEEDAIGDLAVASDKAIGVIGSFVTSATVGGRKLDASASPATFVAKLAP
jgi:hypothetical protein